MDIFKNLKVLDLSSVLAGPSVGFFFAELGSKVVKIENKKTGGDVTRTWKLPQEKKSSKESAYYWSVNALKEICFLNFDLKEDLEKLYALVKDADIVIANFKKGDDIKLGVDFKTLSKINSKLIYASINGFGEQSPRVAYDLILQAESGFMSMNGKDENSLSKMPVAIIDLLAAHQIKEAILIAMLQQKNKVKAINISVSLFDSALASLANQASNWLNQKYIPKPIGSLHPNIAPYGEIFFTKDNHQITFAIGSDKQFEDLCYILKMETNKNYSSNQLRIKHRTKLFEIIQEEIKQWNYKKLFSACIKKNIPVAKIRNMKEVFSLPESKLMTREFLHQNKNVKYVSSVAFKFLK
jgi:crotonobetainyl-CoA:carnitine CoA-transferase CaiB-like acyl-CoA transferase